MIHYLRSPGCRQAALLLLIALVALNLRPFLAAPGPLLGHITAELGMGYSSASLLTLLPFGLMGAGAFAAPRLIAARGARAMILLALALLLAGSALRMIVPDTAALLATAVLCGAGAALIQSAMPGVIKARFPARVPAVTGLYSGLIMAGGAAGAQLMPVLTEAGTSWRTALAAPALLAAVTLAAAVLVLPRSAGTGTSPAGAGRIRAAGLLARRRTWLLMAAFGLMNGGYSSLIAWLAPYYQELGWGMADSALLISVLAAGQTASAIGLPVLAGSSMDRRPWLGAALAMQCAGFAGLAFAPAAAPLAWAALCGAGLGGCFSLSIVTALDHLDSPAEAGALAALMQGGGFLITSVPPFAVAQIHQWTGSLAGGWLFHLGCAACAVALCLRFNPRRYPAVMGAAIP